MLIDNIKEDIKKVMNAVGHKCAGCTFTFEQNLRDIEVKENVRYSGYVLHPDHIEFQFVDKKTKEVSFKIGVERPDH